VANRLVGDRADRGDDLVAHLLERRVDEQYALVADLQRDVSAGADQHVDVALDVQHVDRGVREILVRPRGDASARDAENTGERPRRREARPARSNRRAHFAVSLSMYSGYIVSAPPRAASGGMPYLAGNSPRNAFAPGR